MIALVGKAGRLLRGPAFDDRNALLDEVCVYQFHQVISLQEGWSKLFGHYDEAKDAQAQGMIFIQFALSNFFPPTVWEAKTILENICLSDFRTYLHCLKGVDRTGFICALYLVLVDGWDPMDAWYDAKKMGMHWHFHYFWEDAFHQTVKDLSGMRKWEQL